MADPGDIVLYHDPFDASCSDDLYNFFDAPNPTLEDLSLIDGQPGPTSSTSIPQHDGIVADASDPFDDPILWDIHFSPSSQGGHSQILAETNIQQAPQMENNVICGNMTAFENQNFGNAENANYINIGLTEGEDFVNNTSFFNENYENARPPDNQNDGNMWPPEDQNHEDVRPLAIWPEPPAPYLCSYCMVLRELIHTNGRDDTKLEIHGRLGMICHAILEIRESDRPVQHQMFDFCNKSIGNVKEFLDRYCNERKQAGFFMLPDPLLFFYETLQVGTDLNEYQTSDVSSQPPPTQVRNTGTTNTMNESSNAMNRPANQVNQQRVENGSNRIRRMSLSVQRERTMRLKLKDLVQYFHLPIDEAAKEMNLCPTVLKKICRRDGLGRWPHRKIKSLERQIANWTPSLKSTNSEERARAELEIGRLKEKMDAICAASSS